MSAYRGQAEDDAEGLEEGDGLIGDEAQPEAGQHAADACAHQRVSARFRKSEAWQQHHEVSGSDVAEQRGL